MIQNDNEIQKWGAISRYRAAALYEQWCQAFKARQTALSYDEWLEQLSGWGVPNPMPRSLVFESEDLRFTLTHGWRYEISHRPRGAREFECLIHDCQLFIAMASRTRKRGPWVSPIGLLSQTDLRRIVLVGLSEQGGRQTWAPEDTRIERRSGW